MLEQAPDLRTVGIFEELMRRHPNLGRGVRRTLERRVREWRVLHGPERELEQAICGQRFHSRPERSR